MHLALYRLRRRADGWLASAGFAGILFFLPFASLNGQVPIVGSGGVVRIHNTDLAVLEAREERKDLPCAVAPEKPFLGFDLRMHAGYDVSIPLKELAGNENLLTILFRVTPLADPAGQKYFVQRIRVPAIEDDAKGDAMLQGGFDVGEGSYRVDWLMRDRAERVCAAFWEFEASLPGRDRQITLTIAPNTVEPVEVEQFREEPPVVRETAGGGLNVKILMNFAPQKTNASALRPLDTIALVSILRSITREPRIGKFSLVAFNLKEQKVVFRQDNVDRIDFPSLGQSLNSISPGTIDLSLLTQKHGETEFLSRLVSSEFERSSESRPDAFIFAGPKAMLDAKVPEETLRPIGDSAIPVFYMNYNLYPQANPWRDTIGHMVRSLKGYEYTISRPRDLWFAVTDLVNRVVKSRNEKQIASVSSN
jgi:hypothetical protein